MKFILLSLFILFPVVLPADFVYGPKIDYKGKASDSGKQLFEWFNPRYPDWRTNCFFESNKKLVAWEIEKMFKEKTFKMDFFQKTYVNMECAVYYLVVNSDNAKKLIELAVLYHQYGEKTLGLPGNEKLEYFFMKTIPSFKKKTETRFGKNKVERIIKKYDMIYSRNPHLSLGELREKTYDNYMRVFKRAGYGTKAKEEFAVWMNNWKARDIILDILKQKAVTGKNIYMFANLLAHFDKVPDDIAESVIRYFKLDTPSPLINLASLRMMGMNPKLTKAVLKNFKYIKGPDFVEDYYSAAAMMLNYKISGTPGRLIKSMGYPTTVFLIYARARSNYDAAFKKYTQQKSRKKAERWGAVNYLQGALVFLSKGSNLSMQTAVEILNSNTDILQTTKSMLDGKFGKLLRTKHLKLPPVRKLPLGICFPFESLTKSGQKILFKTYAAMLKDKKYKDSHKAVIEALLHIKSPKYRKETIRLLMKTKVHYGNKALEGISLKWLPELLKIAAGKDPQLGVKACQLIGKMSILGLPAAPELKNLLKTTKDFTIKIASICALAEIGDRSSISLIKQYFNDKNRLLARAAKQAVYLLQPIDKNDPYFEEMLRKKAKGKYGDEK